MVRREKDGVWATLRETIASHPEEVFACFTTADGLIRWFPVAAEMDLRAGGRILLGWDSKFFRRLVIRIHDYDPGGTISWEWPVGVHGEETVVTWKVEPSVEEGSVVTMRMGPFPVDVDRVIEVADDVESWRWYLCNLRTVLEARTDMRAVRPL